MAVTGLMNRQEIEDLGLEFDRKEAQEVLQWALQEYHDNIALSCSFGAEDVVLVDMIARIRPGSRVFTLDTGLLFPETHEVIKRIQERYPITLEIYTSDITIEEMEKRYGKELYHTNPDLCCQLRKIQPLQKALAGLKAWITGLRRDQAPTRAHTKKVEIDPKFGLIKVNPLADWHWEQVWTYIRENKVPYNTLHDQNYPSIGCAPCTRPVRPGEDPRAGRWPGKGKIECGLHPASNKEKE
jgi:phosphoadenosine phosphosulfate reductase